MGHVGRGWGSPSAPLTLTTCFPTWALDGQRCGRTLGLWRPGTGCQRGKCASAPSWARRPRAPYESSDHGNQRRWNACPPAGVWCGGPGPAVSCSSEAQPRTGKRRLTPSYLGQNGERLPSRLWLRRGLWLARPVTECQEGPCWDVSPSTQTTAWAVWGTGRRPCRRGAASGDARGLNSGSQVRRQGGPSPAAAGPPGLDRTGGPRGVRCRSKQAGDDLTAGPSVVGLECSWTAACAAPAPRNPPRFLGVPAGALVACLVFPRSALPVCVDCRGPPSASSRCVIVRLLFPSRLVWVWQSVGKVSSSPAVTAVRANSPGVLAARLRLFGSRRLITVMWLRGRVSLALLGLRHALCHS